MGQTFLNKYFSPTLGVDLKSSPMAVGMNMCVDMMNADLRETPGGEAIGKRKGFCYCAGGFIDAANYPTLWDGAVEYSEGAVGFFAYGQVSPVTGLESTQLLVAMRALYRMLNSTVTLTYNGLGTATVTILPKPPYGGYYLTLTDTADVTAPHEISLGRMDSVGADNTLESLETALAGFGSWVFTIGSGRGGYTSAAVGPATTISVDDGAGGAHNLLVGDIVRIPLAAGGVTYRKITAVNAASTNISFDGALITVGDNARIRLALVSQMASVLPQTQSGNLTVGNSVTIPVLQWDSVYYPKALGAYPWATTMAARGATNFRPMSSQPMNNNLYIACAHEPAATSYMKYDGQNCYRAGLPQPVVAIANTGAGLVDIGTHEYIAVFSHLDAQGNLIESIPSEPAVITIAGAAATIQVTVTNGLLAWTAANGFQTNYARVAGAQVGVTTINVDGLDTLNDHCLHVGDSVYFYDAVAAAYTTRTVTAATYPHAGAGGTITISGAAVNVANNDYITNNLKVDIYRTMVSGSSYYRVASIPVEIEAATTVYNDTIADAGLGVEFLYPETNEEHGLAPTAPRSITTYQGSIVLGGSLTYPNDWFPSATGQPEYFPQNLQAESGRATDDQIVGVGVVGENLILFKNRSSYVVTGMLIDAETLLPQWRLDTLSDSVGCCSHLSIVPVGDQLFWMDLTGPYAMNAGGAPVFIGELVSPLITVNKISWPSNLYYWFDMPRCVSVYDRVNQKVLMYIPAGNLTLTGVDKFSDNVITSRVLAYDVKRSGRMGFPVWRIWGWLGMNVGAVNAGDDIYFGRNWAYAVGSKNFFMGKFLNNNFHTHPTTTSTSFHDYWDSFDPMNWWVTTGWEQWNDAESEKIIKRLVAYGHEYFKVGIAEYRDFQPYAYSTAITNWGTVTFSNFLTKLSGLTKRLRNRPTKVKSLQINFSESAIGGNDIRLLGWELEGSIAQVPKVGRQG